MILRSVTLLLALCVSACGNEPTAPTSLPATLTHLTLSPQVSVILIGRPLQLTANGIFSDGSARRVDVTFIVDDPRRASVNASGLVTAQQPGPVSIMATSEGKSATLVLTALPDFSGHWDGAGVLTTCQGTADQCALQLRRPTANIAVFVDQIDRRIRALVVITGAAYSYQTWADGTITDTGEMLLSGEAGIELLPGRGFVVVMRVTNWRSTVSDTGTMAGSTSAALENSASLPATAHQVSVAFEGLRRTRAGAQDSNRF